MISRLALRFLAIGYLALLLVLPLGFIAWHAFEGGAAAAWGAITTTEALHALWLTVLIALIAVPANTIFGVLAALLLVRGRFPGKTLLGACIDLPLGVSPIVVGLALILVYGQYGWFGGWLADRGIQVIFSLPGMVLATIFISLPFVAREVVPVLQEIGTEQERAAHTLGASSWQAFWRITLPSIRSGIGYGIVLATARALGEFGAVSVISGRLVGQTETLTLYVQDRFEQFDTTGAYASSVLLALVAVTILVLTNMLRPKEYV
jgi:sulfate/thiosulfate transport system permease protein